MDHLLNGLELTGTIDEHHQLKLDGALPIAGPLRVKVVLHPLEIEDESQWLSAAARNPAFADLADPREDIYSPEDGKPFHDPA